MHAHKTRLTAAAPVFAALGDPIRLGMVARLCTDGPLPTIRLTQATDLTRQAVTKHLQLLENAKIVTSQRVGRDRLWRIEPKRLHDARKYLDQISAEWDDTLQRLRTFVEKD